MYKVYCIHAHLSYIKRMSSKNIIFLSTLSRDSSNLQNGQGTGNVVLLDWLIYTYYETCTLVTYNSSDNFFNIFLRYIHVRQEKGFDV